MNTTTKERLAAAEAELKAAEKHIQALSDRYQQAIDASSDGAHVAEASSLQGQRSTLLAKLFHEGAAPEDSTELKALDERIATAKAMSKPARDRAEGARIVAAQLAEQVRAASACTPDLVNRMREISLQAMAEDIEPLVEAYKLACASAAAAFAKLLAARRVHDILALSMGRGALGNLMTPTALTFPAPGMTPNGALTIDTRDQIREYDPEQRASWRAAGLLVPAN